jgi:hypothetical protein
MALGILENFELAGRDPDGPEVAHLRIEAMKLAFADIYRYVADPAFVSVPQAGLISRRFADERRKLFDPAKAILYPPAGMPEGSPTSSPRAQGPAFDDNYDGELHTTSFEIVDKFARKEIFIEGALAQQFQEGVEALNQGEPSEEDFDDFIEAYKRNLKNTEKAYHLLSLHHNALLLQNMELRSDRAKSCWWCRLKYTVATFRGKEE